MITRITPRKLNADTDERSLNADEMKYALNISVDANSDGDGAVVKCSEGNVASLPSDELGSVSDGVNTVIGSVTDEELGVVYFFVHNTSGDHAVYAYSEKTDTYRVILKTPALNFDRDGFVKGDVVRVKRLTELAPINIQEDQGSEGGAVVDDDGPVIDGPEPIIAVPVTIVIERDLMPLVELHADVHDPASAISNITPSDFSAFIQGTVDTSIIGARRMSVEPVQFYQENEDTNIGEFASETFNDVQFTVQQQGRKLSLVAECTVYLRPQHVDNPTLSLNVALRYESDLPLQTWTSGSESNYGGGTVQNVSEGSFMSISQGQLLSENIVLDDLQDNSFSNEGKLFAFGDSATAETLNAYSLFSLPTIPDPTFSEISSEWLFKELNVNLSSLSVNDGEISIGEIRPLKDRVMPAIVEIDYTPSSAYQKAQEVAEFLGYFNDGDGPEDFQVEEVVLNRGVNRVSDAEEQVEFFYATTCPYTFGYKLYYVSGVAVDRVDESGQLRTYTQLTNEALSHPSWGSASMWPVTQGGAAGPTQNPYTFPTFSSMVNAGSQALGGLPFSVPVGSGYNAYNFVIVDGVAGEFGTDACPAFEPQEFFVPSLYVLPASTEAFDERGAKSYAPYNKEPLASDASVEDFVSYFSNPKFQYLIEIPVSGPMDGEGFDSIICAYNESDIDIFKGPEQVIIDSGYDYKIYSSDSSFSGEKLISDQVLEEILTLPNNTDYSFNFPGTEFIESTIVQGRRVRVQIKDNGSVFAVPASALMPRGQFNSLTGSYGSVRCTPSQEAPTVPFCFSSGVACSDEARQISLLAPPEVLPPPVIVQGDPVVEEGTSGSTSSGSSGSTQTPTTSAPSPVRRSEPTITSSKTKKTIKKKY